MSVKANDIVKRFFLFAPSFGRREGEEERKLLFYYPQNEELNIKLRGIGYAEAFHNFASNFTGGYQPYTEIGTTFDFEVTTEIEPGFFASFGFDNKLSSTARYSLRGEVLANILRRFYETFRLFYGLFESHVIRIPDQFPDAEKLRQLLDHFCPRYFNLLRLNLWPLMDLLEGARKMSLDSVAFLKIQSVINLTEERYPGITMSMMMCNDRLLWHHIPEHLRCVLYRYLINFLLPRTFRVDLQPETRRRTRTSSNPDSGSPTNLDEVAKTGLFVRGPGFILPNPDSMIDGCPKVFLDPTLSGKLYEYFLVVYRVQNVAYVLLVPCEAILKSDNNYESFISEFEPIIESPMADLATCLMEQFAQNQNDPSQNANSPHLYYDKAEWTLYSTYDPRNALDIIPHELFGTMCDSRRELMRQKSSTTSKKRETSLTPRYASLVSRASDGDYWLAAKFSAARELYAVVARKNATSLEQVNEEVNRLCAIQYENQFSNDS